MLYTVKLGDTLYKLSRRFNTTVESILNANVICNPNLISVGLVLLIPEPELDLPRAGGSPYYVIEPGDTLSCLARQFNIPIETLVRVNQIQNPNLIFAGSELLLWPEIPDPQQLKTEWERAGELCDQLNSLQIHGTFYLGTFRWAALGSRAVPYLQELLNHPCALVRYYAVLSLGRIGQGGGVRLALLSALNDPEVSDLARLALRRNELLGRGRGRVHILVREAGLANAPFLDAPVTPLPAGTEIIVKRWHIPSPTGEEFPPGGLALWDQVVVVNTGQMGYLLRLGYQEIIFI